MCSTDVYVRTVSKVFSSVLCCQNCCHEHCVLYAACSSVVEVIKPVMEQVRKASSSSPQTEVKAEFGPAVFCVASTGV
jgi:hypothetical protein